MKKLSPKVLLTAASLIAAISATLGAMPNAASAEMNGCSFTENCGQCPAEQHDCGQTGGVPPLGPKPHRIVTFLGTAPRETFRTPTAACRAVYGTEASYGTWFSRRFAKCYNVEIVWL